MISGRSVNGMGGQRSGNGQTSGMQRILIIEDHTDVRRQMTAVLSEAFEDPEICDVATLEQARQQIGSTPFDLVVLDLGLPDGKGEDFICEIRRAQPNAYVVVSTIHDESDHLLAALQNGAQGYLLKEQEFDLLVAEFKGILKGRPPLAPAVTRRLLEHLRTNSDRFQSTAGDGPQPLPPQDRPPERDVDAAQAVMSLTERENEILVLLSKGFNRPEIAGILGISKHTVAAHVAKIYGKLGISSRSEAAVIAEQHRML